MTDDQRIIIRELIYVGALVPRKITAVTCVLAEHAEMLAVLKEIEGSWNANDHEMRERCVDLIARAEGSKS